ncbi:unnamed protein product, partial [Ectocarpus fasciculatus]
MGVACKPVAQVTEVNILKPIESLGSGNQYSARYSIPQSPPSDEMRLFVRKPRGNEPCFAGFLTNQRAPTPSLPAVLTTPATCVFSCSTTQYNGKPTRRLPMPNEIEVPVGRQVVCCAQC